MYFSRSNSYYLYLHPNTTQSSFHPYTSYNISNDLKYVLYITSTFRAIHAYNDALSDWAPPRRPSLDILALLSQQLAYNLQLSSEIELSFGIARTRVLKYIQVQVTTIDEIHLLYVLDVKMSKS